MNQQNVLNQSETCPVCGEYQTVEFVSIVNASEFPELRAKVLDGELNQFFCRKCESVLPNPQTWFYLDNTLSIYAIVVPPDSICNSNFYAQWNPELDRQVQLITGPYELHTNYRLCFGLEDLVRYVTFRVGYYTFRKDVRRYYLDCRVPEDFLQKNKFAKRKRLKSLYCLVSFFPAGQVLTLNECVYLVNCHLTHFNNPNILQKEAGQKERILLIEELVALGLLEKVMDKVLFQVNPEWYPLKNEDGNN